MDTTSLIKFSAIIRTGHIDHYPQLRKWSESEGLIQKVGRRRILTPKGVELVSKVTCEFLVYESIKNKEPQKKEGLLEKADEILNKCMDFDLSNAKNWVETEFELVNLYFKTIAGEIDDEQIFLFWNGRREFNLSASQRI